MGGGGAESGMVEKRELDTLGVESRNVVIGKNSIHVK
jgi:hypothetical protein